MKILLLASEQRLLRELYGAYDDDDILFYTSGKGPLNLPEYQHVENGTLVPGKGEAETTVHNIDGIYPVTLFIEPSTYNNCDALFVRRADDRFSEPAQMIYGKAAQDKVVPELIASFRTVVAKLDIATQVGILEPGIVTTLKEVLRKIE